MAAISRVKMLSPLPATSTQPSAHGYALLGAMPGSAEPAASRTAPKALYSGSRLSMQLKTGLVQRDVDHLARPRRVAVVQRHQDADHAVQRRERVADARRPRAPARGPARR